MHLHDIYVITWFIKHTTIKHGKVKYFWLIIGNIYNNDIIVHTFSTCK